MRRNLLWVAIAFGLVLLGVTLLEQPKTCFACTVPSNPPPPDCSANMTALTMRQADEQQPWWRLFAPREDRVVKVYLGMNVNNASSDIPYEYTLTPSGNWTPNSITPITGTGILKATSPITTIEITLPYTSTDLGDLNLQAQIDSPDCTFNPPNLSATVRLNKQGPTVWPVTSRTCPVAGEKPTLVFGVKNPNDQPQTYNITALANSKYGGDHTAILNDNQAQPGARTFDPMTLKPGEATRIDITCETFGFCLVGSEIQVDLKVEPAPGEAAFAPAIASSNVTIRDSKVPTCPILEDWWALMPPMLFGILVGVPIALALGGGAWYLLRGGTVIPAKPESGGGPRPPRPTGGSSGQGNTLGRGGPPTGGGTDGNRIR